MPRAREPTSREVRARTHRGREKGGECGEGFSPSQVRRRRAVVPGACARSVACAFSGADVLWGFSPSAAAGFTRSTLGIAWLLCWGQMAADHGGPAVSGAAGALFVVAEGRPAQGE